MNYDTQNRYNTPIERGLTVKGTIGTRQKCPECGGKFTGQDDYGFYCPNHRNVRPTRYYVQGVYFGFGGVLYSTPTGKVLSSYDISFALLSKIRTDWDEALRGGKPFICDIYIAKAVKGKQINEIIKSYIAQKERKYKKLKLSRSQWQQVNNINNKFILRFFDKKLIDSITSGDIEGFYEWLQDLQYKNKRGELEEYSSKHIRDIMMMLRCLYNYVKKDIPEFPDGWSEVEPKMDKRTLTLDEQMKIDPHIPNRHGYPLAIHILQNTGMRVCELRALTVGDVTDRGVIVWKSLTDRLRRVRKGYASEQFYPLPKYIMDDLRDHIKGLRSENFVFTVNEQPYKLTTLRGAWYKACENAGVDRIQLNQGGRHTWASREMKEAKDAAMARIEHQLSHTNKKTSKHYIVEG